MFTTILGLTPSTSARSPKIWNKLYAHFNINCQMIPFDCSTEQSFSDTVRFLRQCPDWVGSLVAAPYKQLAFSLSRPNTLTIESIQSANLLIPFEEQLLSDNTDGAAAINCILELSKSPSLICQFGFGGTGRAVLFNLAQAYPSIPIHLYTRQNLNAEFPSNITIKSYSELADHISGYDLLINTTSLGDLNHMGLSVLSSAQSKLIKENARLFDVVYQPSTTPFLQSSSSPFISNGSVMNLRQALIAFSYLHPQVSLSQLISLDPSLFI